MLAPWATRRRHGELAAAADRRHPRGGDVGRLRCEKRFIVDDERIRLGLRDRRDVLFVTDVAHLSLCAAGDARLMATLYHVPTSRSFRVLWTLEEIGATVEVKSLGVRPRLQEPEYLAINPAGTLPAPDRRRPCDLRIACDLRIPRGPAWFRPDRGTGRAGAAGVRAMAVVRRGDSAGAALGDGACPPYPEHDAGDAGRHRCCAVRRAPLALDAGKATRAAAGGS